MADAAENPASGLAGARFVAKTRPNTTASSSGKWTSGRSGVSTVTSPESAGTFASSARSYAR